MKTRTDLLNHLAEKYNLQRYLEIGVQNKEQNFNKIKCRLRVCVDPDPKAEAGFPTTSDHFFQVMHPWWVHDGNAHMDKFDLIFIDGLHTAEQVKKDFENALKILSPNGFIVLHDCNPEKEEHTIVPRPKPTGHWNGDVWRFAAGLRTINKEDRFTVDIDNGCCVVRGRAIGTTSFINDWDYFDDERKELLNLITWDEFISIGAHV